MQMEYAALDYLQRKTEEIRQAAAAQAERLGQGRHAVLDLAESYEELLPALPEDARELVRNTLGEAVRRARVAFGVPSHG